MITSISSVLEEKIRAAKETERSKKSMLELFQAMEKSVAAEELWLVPAAPAADLTDPDGDEGIPIEGLDNIRLLHGYCERDSKEFTCIAAYTSREQIEKSTLGVPGITVSIKAANILQLAIEREEAFGLSLNPGADQFIFEKKGLEAVLIEAAKLEPSDWLPLLTYQVEPRTVIDTDRIIADWAEGWKDSEDMEHWSLKSYPVMADGTVLLIFEMEEEIYGNEKGKICVTHKEMYYRVLHYDISGEPKILNRYRFKAQDGDLVTCHVRNGILYTAMSTRFSWKTTILQVCPNDDDAQFEIGSHISNYIVRSDGIAAAGYDNNLMDKYQTPLVFFKEDGEIGDLWINRHVLSCRAMTLDSDENFWTYFYPSDRLSMFDEKNHEIHEFSVALQGFQNFGLSKDLSRVVVAFTEHRDQSLIYVMNRADYKSFSNPVRFDFQPRDTKGKIIEAPDCDYFGCPSILKDTMILRADGMLYIYNLNDFCDESRTNLGNVEQGKT